MDPASASPRRAGAADAAEVARLLHDFNTEFETPSPGEVVLTARLRALFASRTTIAVLAGQPSTGVALVTLRSNVWFEGSVALLDELYVRPSDRGHGIGTGMLALAVSLCRSAGARLMEINVDEGDGGARRFYERHGFSATEPDTGELALYYWRDLT